MKRATKSSGGYARKRKNKASEDMDWISEESEEEVNMTSNDGLDE